MIRRPESFKIDDIRFFRRLTNLLGKLEVPTLYKTHTQLGVERLPDGTLKFDTQTKTFYGYGLKESKDAMERMFDYYTPQQLTHADILRNDNMIKTIKSVRHLCFFMRRLGMQSTQDLSGLTQAKQYMHRINHKIAW